MIERRTEREAKRSNWILIFLIQDPFDYFQVWKYFFLIVEKEKSNIAPREQYSNYCNIPEK